MGALGSVPMVIDVEMVKLIQKCAMLGQQKLFKESARDVEKRKSNTRQCSLATLGNLLLPEAREELLRNQLILLGHIRLRFAPYVVRQFALLRLILHNDKYNNNIN